MVEGWKDEGLFGRGGKRGAGAEAWKKAEGVVAVIQQHTQRERKPWLWMERGERGERKAAKGKKAEGVVAVIQQHTQREKEGR